MKTAQEGISPRKELPAAGGWIHAQPAEVTERRRFAVNERGFDRAMAGGNQAPGLALAADQHFGVPAFNAERGQIIGRAIKGKPDRPGHRRLEAELQEFPVILRRGQPEAEAGCAIRLPGQLRAGRRG